MAPATRMEYSMPTTDYDNSSKNINNQNTNENYAHKKFSAAYTHKKFGNRIMIQRTNTPDTLDLSANLNKITTTTTNIITTQPGLFRPYALSDQTTIKRRSDEQIIAQQPQAKRIALEQRTYTPATPAAVATRTQPPSQPQYPPVWNHQHLAVMLHKQRAALQMRELLRINPDTNSWPMEWRDAFYAMLYN